METIQVLTQDPNVQTSVAILREVLGSYHPRNFAVRLWEGTTWHPENGNPALFTLVLRHPGTLRHMFLHVNQLALGEAYIYDDFDIEGDICAAFDMADHLFGLRMSLAEKVHLAGLLHKLPPEATSHGGRGAAQLHGALHTKERDRQAVTYHYNVSNEFFALWLDRRMTYSSGYFETPEDDLETAQERKLDYLCRKLRLLPGERLLDIGCGWGALVIHAAKKYGASALGITLSEPQTRLANERLRQEGLLDRCSVEICDYRDIEAPGSYDKIVSVGMFEHVGESMLLEYFDRAYRLLRPGGVFLNHGLGLGFHRPTARGLSFSDRYIFPDSELVPIGTALRIAEVGGFEVRDVESLREHYALTLRHWLRRLEARHEEAIRIVDEPTYRTWRLMDAGSAHSLEEGRLSVYQTVLVKALNGDSHQPLTRKDWYV